MEEPLGRQSPAAETDFRSQSELSSQVFLSVVIPAHNESSRIVSTLHQVLHLFESRPEPYEVVVVDDGSTDNTVALVEKVRQKMPAVRLVRNPVRAGKGFAVRSGMLSARGEYLLFTDADLSAPIAEADRLLEALRNGYDVAIGSRALKPEWISPRQSRFRQSAGKLFNLGTRWITRLDFQDTQCGFKLFRRPAAEILFARQRIPGFGFDVELLYLARKFGYRALEVPVHWGHSAGSKVRLLRDSARMFLDLLRIRWNDWRGKYAVEVKFSPELSSPP